MAKHLIPFTTSNMPPIGCQVPRPKSAQFIKLYMAGVSEGFAPRNKTGNSSILVNRGFENCFLTRFLML